MVHSQATAVLNPTITAVKTGLCTDSTDAGLTFAAADAAL